MWRGDEGIVDTMRDRRDSEVGAMRSHSKRVGASREFALYLGVVPWYRTGCIEALLGNSQVEFTVYAADYALEPSVRTGVPQETYKRVRRVGLLGNKLLLTFIPLAVLRSDGCVIDLNPRSLSAWLILGLRKIMRKRVVVWGHLYPRQGPNSKTAAVRKYMRSLADGTILYDYESVEHARTDIPSQPVWTAPNAIYRRSDLHATSDVERRSFVYVGRLVEQKKVDQIVPAFVRSGLWEAGYNLEIVGDGAMAAVIDEQIASAPADARALISRPGPITGTEALQKTYGRSLCSISPGYVGLNATQSLGFGVPMIFSLHEAHAPEIELVDTGAMFGYEESSPAGLADAMRYAAGTLREFTSVERESLSRTIAQLYSAESMAEGILDALQDEARAPISKVSNVGAFK